MVDQVRDVLRSLRDSDYTLEDVESIQILLDRMRIMKHQPVPITEEKVIMAYIRRRFNDYKQGLKNATGIRIHYNAKKLGGIDQAVEMCKRIIPFKYCEGHSGNEGACEVLCDGFGDNLKITFNCLTYDHNYDQAFIKASLTHALEYAVAKGKIIATTDNEIKERDWNIGYIKKNGPEYRRCPLHKLTSIQRRITEVVECFVDLDLVIKDLYGTNISVRCPNCHQAAAKRGDHEQKNLERYIKKSDQKDSDENKKIGYTEVAEESKVVAIMNSADIDAIKEINETEKNEMKNVVEEKQNQEKNEYEPEKEAKHESKNEFEERTNHDSQPMTVKQGENEESKTPMYEALGNTPDVLGSIVNE